MANYLLIIMPLLCGILVWVIRLEVRIAKMESNLRWIKKEMLKCLQS